MLIRGSPDGLHHPHPQLVAIPEMGGRDPSERVVVFNWNEWSRSIGIAGRDQPVRASGMVRLFRVAPAGIFLALGTHRTLLALLSRSSCRLPAALCSQLSGLLSKDGEQWR